MNEKNNIDLRNKKLDQIKIKDDIFCDCGKLLKKYRFEDNLYLCCNCGEVYLPSDKTLKMFNISRKKTQKTKDQIIQKTQVTEQGIPFFCEACNQETTAKTIVLPPRFGDEANLVIIICNRCNKVYREGNEY